MEDRKQLIADKSVSSVVLGILTLFAFGFRVYHLGNQSFWLDETFSYFVASRQDVFSIVRLTAMEDNHPPLYYLILHLWMPFAGSSEFALRFVSVMAGTIAIPLIANLGAHLFNRRVGYVAAALLTVSPFHIWYSQEARMYALVCVLAIASVALYLRCLMDESLGEDGICHRPSPKRMTSLTFVFTPQVAYVIVTVLMLLSHYYGFFVVLFENIVAITIHRERLSLKKWLLLQSSVAVVFSPWLLAIWQQFQRAPRDFKFAIGLFDVARNLNVTFSLGDMPARWIEPAHLGFLSIIILGGSVYAIKIIMASRNEAKSTALNLTFVILYLMTTPVIAYLASLALSMNLRAGFKMYYIVILPAYVVLLAFGVNSLAQYAKTLGVVALIFIVVVSLVSITEQFANRTKEDFRSIASYVANRETPKDVIVLNAEHIYTAFAYYYRGISFWHRAEVSDREGTANFLDKVTRNSEGAWLVLSREELADPQGFVKSWFDTKGLLLDERWFIGGRVLYYSLEPRPNFSMPKVTNSLEPTPTFGASVKLMGYELANEVKSGSQVKVKLFWQSLARPVDDYRVVIYLEDSSGRVWAQSDHVPLIPAYGTSKWAPGEYLTDSHYLSVDLGVPPGTYNVKVRLYSSVSGATLRPDGLDSDWVSLTKLRILKPSAKEVNNALRSAKLSAGNKLNDDIALLQGRIGQRKAITGERIELSLLWQALSKPKSAYEVIFELVGEGNAVVQQIRLPMVGGRYPTTEWEAGEVVKDYYDLTLSNRLKGGEYRIRIGLVEANDDRVTAPFEIGKVSIRSPERSFVLLEPKHAYEIDLGGKIVFLGHDLANEKRKPGEKITFSSFWRAKGEMSQSYKVFVHLLGPGNRVVAQQDKLPLQGSRPTSSWAFGEIIKDEHELVVPADAPAGDYRLEIGFYDPGSGERLTVDSADPKASENAILLREWIVVEPY